MERYYDQKTYAIIAEYDNFANTILSTAGEEAYGKLRHMTIVDKKGQPEANGNFSRLRGIVSEE